MPPVNYLFDNSEADAGDITPSFATMPKAESVGTSEKMDEKLGAYLHLNKPDVVNHPSHYTAGKVECIDALEAATVGLIGIQAVCTANAIKYLWRWKFKGGTQDLEKAKWYIDRLIQTMKKEDKNGHPREN